MTLIPHWYHYIRRPAPIELHWAQELGNTALSHPWLRSISTSLCKKVLTLKTAEPKDWDIPSDRYVSHGGFSLHANTYCAPTNRGKLEQLCRYITRPALANDGSWPSLASPHKYIHVQKRVKVNHNGDVVLKLKSAYRDGTTHLVMTPLEFMQKLAALIPRPRLNLTRYHGVLAPNAKLRSQIIPQPPDESGGGDVKEEIACSGIRKQYIPWPFSHFHVLHGTVTSMSNGHAYSKGCLVSISKFVPIARVNSGSLPQLKTRQP